MAMANHENIAQLREALGLLGAENERLRRPINQAVQDIEDDFGSESASVKRQRLEELLGDALIAQESASPELLTKIDEVLPTGPPSAALVDVERLRKEAYWVDERLCLWLGDITLCAVDAIVNAANENGLGCFIPKHKCVDNVIHRAAGPRLRAECIERMQERPGGIGSLVAGSNPIVTQGHRLPSRYVIHVTGPNVAGVPTPSDAKKLAASYRNCLDTALSLGLESIAFPCLSTGLFGYPSDRAAKVALAALREWLAKHADAKMVVVFDLFADADVRAFERQLFGGSHTAGDGVSNAIAVASTWLRQADAVLICAGAGMSGNEGEMVYTNPTDFKRCYPWLVPYGYTTAYECMGLMKDSRVPDQLKRSYLVAHANNQRYRFLPNPGYEALLAQLHSKDYFVYTSNVDGCFVRAGFDDKRIYTPQGDWMYMQCEKPCTRDSYWLAKPDIDRVVTSVPDVPDSLLPRCSRCGRKAVGNVRGGSWFTHAPHDQAQDRFLAWVDRQLRTGSSDDESPGNKLVILEVGVGFNTPTVTRLPMEQICRENSNVALVRINPQDFKVPRDLKDRAVGIAMGWTADVATALFAPPHDGQSATETPLITTNKFGLRRHPPAGSSSSGSFDWHAMLTSLRN